MQLYLLIHLSLVLFPFALLLLTLGNSSALSYLFGGLLTLANTLTLFTTISLIIKKKLVALNVLIIVFKYAILAGFIYYVVNLSWLSIVWLSVGVSSLLPAVVILAFLAPNYLKQFELKVG